MAKIVRLSRSFVKNIGQFHHPDWFMKIWGKITGNLETEAFDFKLVDVIAS